MLTKRPICHCFPNSIPISCRPRPSLASSLRETVAGMLTNARSCTRLVVIVLGESLVGYLVSVWMFPITSSILFWVDHWCGAPCQYLSIPWPLKPSQTIYRFLGVYLLPNRHYDVIRQPTKEFLVSILFADQ